MQCVLYEPKSEFLNLICKRLKPRRQRIFPVIKPTRCIDFFKFYFETKLYMFRTVPLSIIMSYSLYTQQRYMSYRFVDSFRSAGSGWNCSSILICPISVYKPVWYIQFLCARWEAPDDGQRNCPKHVEFHLKITFEKISECSWFYYRDLSRCTVTQT
jgi:hypothetical protein